FASGNFNEAALMPLNLRQHVVNRSLLPFVKRVRSVAPHAPEITGREAHEDTRLTGPRRLTLDGIENFVNRQHELALRSFYYSIDVGDLRIGTSGWSYPSGRGTWNGIFYPPTRGRSKDFDELSFYAEHFNTVEVNSTFYGQPRGEVTRGWAERT